MAVWKRKEGDYPSKGFDLDEFKEAYKDGVLILKETRDSVRDFRDTVYGGIENARRKVGLKPSKKYGGKR